MIGGPPADAGPPAPLPRSRPDALELVRVAVPLPRPFRSAHGVEAVRRAVLVRAVGADGVEGWGECSALARPTYTGEWHDGAWLVLRHELAPAVVAGRDHGVRGHPMAVAAVEGALVDLALRRAGRSLAAALGATRHRVDTTAVVDLATGVDELLERVAAAVALGHRSVKLKVRPGADVGPLRAVRSTWPALAVAADANGAYAGDPDAVLALDRLGLAYLEQPLDPDDLVGHAALTRRLTTPVALDESVPSPGAVAAALALGAADVVNLKPARLGGLAAAVEAHRLLVEAGVPAFVGGLLELGVGRATALAVAGLPGCTLPTDLGPSSRYVDDDLTPPFELGPDATLGVPTGAGIGVVPRPARLDEVAVERVVIEA